MPPHVQAIDENDLITVQKCDKRRFKYETVYIGYQLFAMIQKESNKPTTHEWFSNIQISSYSTQQRFNIEYDCWLRFDNLV